MSADVIRLATASGRKQHRGGRKRKIVKRDPSLLTSHVSQALRVLRVAEEYHASGEGDPWAFVKLAKRDLERGVEDHTESARRDVRRIVLDAFGPDVTCGEITGARSALSLILRALPVYNDN